jgi:hypothetical protein
MRLDDQRLRTLRHATIIIVLGMFAFAAGWILLPNGIVELRNGYVIGFVPALTGVFGLATGTVLITVGARYRKAASSTVHEASAVRSAANPSFDQATQQPPPLGSIQR